MLFAAFATLFFMLLSPVLGAVDTVAGQTVRVVSLVCTSRLDHTAAVLAVTRCWSCSMLCRQCLLCRALANREH